MKEITWYILGDQDWVSASNGMWAKRADVEALLKQFPDGMESCTFEVLECAKGHARLHATNWIDHGCRTCKEAALQKELTEVTAKALAATWLLVQEGVELGGDLAVLHDETRAVLMGKDKQTITRLEDQITALRLELSQQKRPPPPQGVRAVYGVYAKTLDIRHALQLVGLHQDAQLGLEIEVLLP